jgi:hypothetical protein
VDKTEKKDTKFRTHKGNVELGADEGGGGAAFESDVGDHNPDFAQLIHQRLQQQARDNLQRGHSTCHRGGRVDPDGLGEQVREAQGAVF